MELNENRRLASLQRELVISLFNGENVPAGFRAAELARTQDALFRKRAWCVAEAWPHLARFLGSSYLTEFQSFVVHCPYPDARGSLSDGRAFASFLSERRSLPGVGKIQALAYDLEAHRRNRKGSIFPIVIKACLTSHPKGICMGWTGRSMRPMAVFVPLAFWNTELWLLM